MSGSKTLNVYNKQIISKEEIKSWDSSLRELIGSILFYKGSATGILDNETSPGVFQRNMFLCGISGVSADGKINISSGIGILSLDNGVSSFVNPIPTINNSSIQDDQKVVLFNYGGVSALPIPNFSSYVNGDVVYVGFIPKLNCLEKGVCSISASNQVEISSDSNFLRLRDQTYKNPTKIKFYSSDGTRSSLVNNEIYEVIEIVDDNHIIISGSVSVETDLRMMIVGSYDLSINGTLDDKCSYVEYDGFLDFSTDTAHFIDSGGFKIASLVFSAPNAYTISDLRSDHLMNFFLPENISYKDVNEVVTGEKTFSGKIRINNTSVEVFNAAQLIAPLTIGSLRRIVIPNNGTTNQYDGSVFNIKGEPGNSILEQLRFYTTAFDEIGQKVFLRIDSSGEDISINLTNAANYLKTNAQSTGTITIPKGSVIELLRDSNLSWIIMNFSGNDTGWVKITSITDSAVSPQTINTSTSNLFYYRVINGVVFLKIVGMNLPSHTQPLKFTLPAAAASLGSGESIELLWSANTYIYINHSGVCSLYCPNSISFSKIITYIP